MIKVQNKEFENIVKQLLKNCQNNNFAGHDPYDALNSEILENIKSKSIRLLISQLFVYSPFNLRKFFRVNRGVNPKGMGLFLSAFCKLNSLKLNENYSNQIRLISNWIIKNRCNEYNGACWGYNFPWQSLKSYKSIGIPTIVNTSFIANALIDAYETTGDERYFLVAETSSDFILKDLPVTISKEGICFSYSPIEKNIVHNANALGAALLARIYSINKDSNLKMMSDKAFDYLIYNQNKDGMWSYSFSDNDKKLAKIQTDWHQGFIIDSINDYIRFCNPSDSKYKESLILATNFYKKNQFTKRGISFWRHPVKWPVDIHNQAQGIITFSKMSKYDENYIHFAKEILSWTLKNLYDNSGFFYFQKWPFLINKIDYIRWSQAWMSVALSTYLQNFKNLQKLVLN